MKNADARCQAWQSFFIDLLKAQGISSSTFNLVPELESFGDRALVTTAIAAKGNPTPPRNFNGHAVVKYKGKLYDPSYGTGPFESLKDWENTGLFRCEYFRNKGDAAPARIEDNTVDKQETKEYLPTLPPGG